MKLNETHQKELEKIVRNIASELSELELLMRAMDNEHADKAQQGFNQVANGWHTLNELCLD